MDEADQLFRCRINTAIRLTDKQCRPTNTCSIEGRSDVKAMTPPEFCTSPARDSDPSVCSQYYMRIGGGAVRLCATDPADGRCRPQLSTC
jgi:hypothetical protein